MSWDLASLVTRLPARVPRRLRPEFAFRPVDLERLGIQPGWAIHAGTTSGLTVRAAIELLESSELAEAPIIGFSTHDRGYGPALVSRFIDHPAFGRMRGLWIDGSLLHFARPLAESAHAMSLASLSVHNLSRFDLGILAAGNLRLLSLRALDNSWVGPEGFQDLARGQPFAELRELVIPSPNCPGGIEAWVKSGRTRHLRVLRLPNRYVGADVNQMTAESSLALLGSELPELTDLDLSSHAIQAASMAAMAANPTLGRLRALTLDRCWLGDAGVLALAGAPWLASVRALVISGNGITDEGALALARSPFAVGIERLGLAQNRIGEPGLRALRELPGVRELSLQ